MADSIIETAAQEASQVAAMGIVMKAMQMHHCYASDTMPDLPAWKAASHTQRQIYLGEWIKAEAYAKADFEETKRPAWIPGGQQYAHQND